MKRNVHHLRSRKHRRRLHAEVLEARRLLAVDTWTINFDNIGNIDLFGPSAAGDLQEEYADNSGSAGGIISTSNVLGQNNEPPVLDAIGSQTVDELAPLAFTATASDPDVPAQPLTFSLAGSVPAGAAITAGGDFSWTPTEAQGPGVFTFDVVVFDGIATDSETITVTVNEVNQAPVLNPIGNQSVDEQSLLSFSASASDADSPANSLTFSLNASPFPVGASITPAGVFSWTPTEAQGPGNYTFEVVVTDNGVPNLSDSETITVTVGDVNAPPVITSNGGGATAAVDVAENQTAVTTVTATDPDLPPNTQTFSISGGADQALFSISAATGVLTFIVPPDFEIPLDAGGDNVYDVQVTATDNGVPSLTDVQDIAVSVTDVNDAPVIISNGAGSTAVVNAAENQISVTTVAATDADLPTQSLTFSISGGADQSLFNIDSTTGVLTFNAAPNFESAVDVGGNGVYDVQVTVTDNGTGALTDTQDIAVTVTDVNDAPVITSNGGGATTTINAAENQTAVTTVTATDPDLPPNTLTFSITGGADQALFSIGAATGLLTFSSTLDFENPADVGGNNVYDVQVTVADNGAPNLTDVQDIAVSVTDVNDAPVITSNGGGATATVNAAENQTAVTTVTATDADLPAQTLTFSISGGADQALFSIVPGTGVLTFNSARDFEVFTDVGGNGIYDVQVTVTDNGTGNLTDVQDIAVTVVDANENPIIISNGGGATAAINAAENQAAVTTVTALDIDLPPQTLTFSISGGADQALFSIVPGTGVLTFNSARDFETPTDSGGNGVYDVQVTVTDNGTGALTDVQDIAVTVTDVNENPVITSDGGGATATINAAENQTAVTTVTATDVDLPAQTLTFSISGGADQALFSIASSTGVLTFNSARDFETPTDAGGNGVYDVQVTVTDNGTGTLTDTQDIAVTVTDVNDAPVITSNGGGATAAINAAENQTAVTTVTALDIDLPAQTLTFSISGGADQALFSIVPGTGVLTFNSARDFETPSDAGGNGVYDVQVTVTDNGTGALTDVQDIAVTVTDVNENPVITSDGGGATAAVNAAENQTAVTTVTATDVDLPAQTLTFSISGGADQALFSIASSTGVLTFNSAADFETPTDSGGNGVYDVQVTVTDNGTGTLTDTQDIAVTVTDVNDAPVITSNGGGATATINAAENQTAVTTVTATDPDLPAQTLTFSISGGADQALFSIVPGTGVLTFNSARDFETPTDAGGNGVYDVQVTVTDNGTGALTDVQDIAVTVTDVNENPVITSDGGGATAAVNAAENQTAVTTVTATDVDLPAQTLTFSISGGADQALFSIASSTGVLAFNSARDFETPTDSGGNGVYDVQVTVTDNGTGTLTDVQEIAVTVTDVDPENTAPVITSDGGGSTATVNAAENQTSVTDVESSDDKDAENAGLTYALTGGADQAFFGINANTGVLTFNSARNFEDPQDAGANGVYDVQVTVTDSGPGGNLTDVQDIAVTVTNVNEGPTAASKAFSSIGNVGVQVTNAANGLLAGATDPDSPETLVITAAQVGDNATTAGGNINISADGTFTYQPPADLVGNDTFLFTIEDAGGLTHSATVTFTISNTIWFIDNSASGSNSGTLADPFQSISAFNASAAPGTGDVIFIDNGSASYTTGINLKNNQILIGEAAGASIATIASLSVPTFSTPLPSTGGAAPVLTDTGFGQNAIDLATNNTIRGLNIGNTGGTGINGADVGTLLIREVGISGTGGGVDLRSAAGSAIDVVLDSLVTSSSTDEGILLSNVSGDFDITSTTGTIIAGGLPGVHITGDSIANKIDLGITLASVLSSGGTVGIQLANTSGSVLVGTAQIGSISQSTADTFNPTTGRPTSVGNGNGILLVDNSGSFTLNGGTFEDIADNAVDIRNSSNTVLKNLTIQDGADGNSFSTGNSAIQWYQGSNLTLDTVTIKNIGDNVVIPTGGVNIQDSGIKAYEVSGDLNIIDSLFDGATGYVFANGSAGSEDRAVEVENASGGDLDVTVTGSTFRNFDFQGLNLRHIGGSLDAIIGGSNASDQNTFQNINGAAINTGPSRQSATGNVHGLRVENNLFSTVGIGVEVFSARGNAIGGVEGTHAFIENNTINGTTSDAIRLLGFASDGGSPLAGSNNPIFRASVTGNSITGVANQLNGFGGGSAFFVAAEDNADSDVTINNNPTVTGGTAAPFNYSGAITTQNQRSGDLDLVLTNNDFDNFSTGAANGFGVGFFGHDLTVAGTQTAIRFGGNDWHNQISGFFETVFFDAGLGTMDVQGYAGGATDAAALVTYLNTVDSNVATFGFTINSGSITGGAASVTTPIAVPTTPLMAADGQGAGAASIDAQTLSGIVDAAMSQLAATGLNASQQTALNQVNFAVVDLTDGMLGQAAGNRILIDHDGAGWGWFVDSTPEDAVEFGAGGPADGRIDLLSAVLHELGHVLGLDHAEQGLMGDTLATSTRGDLDAFFASLDS